jgi:hypothetical protein
MLTIVIPGEEVYDELSETFSTIGDVTLNLEHSLLSLSKWESKFEKPFLSTKDKTAEETLFYIRCMILTPNFTEETFNSFSKDNFESINDYINSKESATTFGTMPETKGKGETITSELIYYWMVAFNIPFDYETWHLNRLFSLIRICNIKQSKPKKMNRNELAQRNAQLNAQRKAALGTNG